MADIADRPPTWVEDALNRLVAIPPVTATSCMALERLCESIRRILDILPPDMVCPPAGDYSPVVLAAIITMKLPQAVRQHLLAVRGDATLPLTPEAIIQRTLAFAQTLKYDDATSVAQPSSTARRSRRRGPSRV